MKRPMRRERSRADISSAKGVLLKEEVLTSRLIDRPLRPLFPEGYYFETQVIASVLSADKTGVTDVIGIIAASAALSIS